MKDAYYFSHDVDARHDPKITRLLLEKKAEGYGIYWVIVEMLRAQETLSLSKNDYDAIAYQSHSDCISVASVVENYGLFKFSKCATQCDVFHSPSLNRRVERFREKSKKYAENAKKRWSKDAMALPTECNGNALKERKGKEIKVNTLAQQTDLFKKETQERFQEVWSQYPKKVDAKKAFIHFKASVKTDEDFVQIKKALANYKNSKIVQDNEDNGKYIKNGATWFNNWKDWVGETMSVSPAEALARRYREECHAAETAAARDRA